MYDTRPEPADIEPTPASPASKWGFLPRRGAMIAGAALLIPGVVAGCGESAPLPKLEKTALIREIDIAALNEYRDDNSRAAEEAIGNIEKGADKRTWSVVEFNSPVRIRATRATPGETDLSPSNTLGWTADGLKGIDIVDLNGWAMVPVASEDETGETVWGFIYVAELVRQQEQEQHGPTYLTIKEIDPADRDFGPTNVDIINTEDDKTPIYLLIKTEHDQAEPANVWIVQK